MACQRTRYGLFAKFYRVNADKNRKYGGRYLWAFSMQGNSRGPRGRIWAESDVEGKGTMHVMIPLAGKTP